MNNNHVIAQPYLGLFFSFYEINTTHYNPLFLTFAYKRQILIVRVIVMQQWNSSEPQMTSYRSYPAISVEMGWMRVCVMCHSVFSVCLKWKPEGLKQSYTGAPSGRSFPLMLSRLLRKPRHKSEQKRMNSSIQLIPGNILSLVKEELKRSRKKGERGVGEVIQWRFMSRSWSRGKKKWSICQRDGGMDAIRTLSTIQEVKFHWCTFLNLISTRTHPGAPMKGWTCGRKRTKLWSKPESAPLSA